MKQRLVRRPQTLSPFGVGAILDVEGESFVAADITRWKHRGEEIREPRLEELLGVTGFRMGPTAPDNLWTAANNAPGIPYFRFPQWLFCASCRRMSRWSINKERGEPPVCLICPKRPALIPMRFVMACPRGHLADVPWVRWAHSRSDDKCEHQDLEFVTRPGGSGLEFLAVRCRACRAERSLAGIASPNSLQALGARCPGRQPWQSTREERQCDAVPQVLQRGATNLTFAVIESSIDIPPYSNWASFSDDSLRVTTTPDFKVIMTAPTSGLVPILIQKIADDLEIDVEEVRRIVNTEISAQGQETAGSASPGRDRDQLLVEEFQAFLAADTDGHPRDRFVKRHVPLTDYLSQVAQGPYGSALQELGRCLGAVVQVTRLREVRALTGFSRLSPPERDSDDGEGPGRFSLYGTRRRIPPRLVPADLGRLDQASRWLPAIEVFGEGIFFSLDEATVRRWESTAGVRERVQVLRERHARSGGTLLPPTPRLVLLHTLAHILIRQLSFECGYTLASLRERVYAAEPDQGHPMAGILIYTAAGDAEGTLGGLVREGQADRLLPTIVKALQTAEWCSSDPLCRESNGQGFGALNLAACHSCGLLPETSCTMANRLLDRVLVLGSTESPEIGFFSELMKQVLAATGAERWGT